MDFLTLEIFRLVAERGSVTQAARELGRAPSNVTGRIRQLEEELGAALFSREGKKMTLTHEGRVFLSYARRLLTLETEARLAVGPAEGRDSVLRLGAMESTAASRLPPALARFNAARPRISVRLKMGSTLELVDWVLAGELDCALVARPPQEIGGLPEADRLAGEPVFVEDLLIASPPGHPPVARAEDLRARDLAALEPGCTYRRLAEHWGRSAKLRTTELASYHAILARVAAGDAAGVLPRSVFEMLAWPSPPEIHSLGPVETLLIHRKDDRPPALQDLREALLA
ncbi:LysR family transcriptional regulator [Neomegalonema sp.]|uniref:LysR family transcriptional regulator n=1 Tax=Neomegalonema sp. TaxID=2039713 RepID=UPI0026287814|nr:LysR family transcriptional regulator [Neomegalonema sp.]MDD2869328.1 LysR family transcriptional regulator [Neomegalonema sp.]